MPALRADLRRSAAAARAGGVLLGAVGAARTSRPIRWLR